MANPTPQTNSLFEEEKDRIDKLMPHSALHMSLLSITREAPKLAARGIRFATPSVYRETKTFEIGPEKRKLELCAERWSVNGYFHGGTSNIMGEDECFLTASYNGALKAELRCAEYSDPHTGISLCQHGGMKSLFVAVVRDIPGTDDDSIALSRVFRGVFGEAADWQCTPESISVHDVMVKEVERKEEIDLETFEEDEM